MRLQPIASLAAAFIVINPPGTLADDLQVLLRLLAVTLLGRAAAHDVDWLVGEK